MKFIQEKNEDDGRHNAVTFLYKIKNGRATTSLGLHCATLAGVPLSTISRGKPFTPYFLRLRDTIAHIFN